MNYDKIPPAVMNSIVRYVERGAIPGHFVTSVIENNLSEAIGNADDESLASIKEIVGFMYNDKLYRFATYTGAKITKLKLEENRIIIYVNDKKHRLEIEATRAVGILLPSPIDGSMTGRILESITAKIYVKLIKLIKKKEKILFEGTGRNAGLDIGGKVEEIKEVN